MTISFLDFKKRESFAIFSSYFQDDKKKFNEFLKNNFSLLMIFSLIEALMEDERYITFADFLKKNFKPISNLDDLNKIEEQYYNNFGAIKKAINFFNNYVDNDCKKIFIYAIQRSSGKEKDLTDDKILKQNISLFYKWRSDFVHSAKISGAFQNYGIFKNGKEPYAVPYKKEDFQLLFEHGFLRYFGFRGNFKHENIESKIEEYKNHTRVIGFFYLKE